MYVPSMLLAACLTVFREKAATVARQFFILPDDVSNIACHPAGFTYAACLRHP